MKGYPIYLLVPAHVMSIYPFMWSIPSIHTELDLNSKETHIPVTESFGASQLRFHNGALNRSTLDHSRRQHTVLSNIAHHQTAPDTPHLRTPHNTVQWHTIRYHSQHCNPRRHRAPHCTVAHYSTAHGRPLLSTTLMFISSQHQPSLDCAFCSQTVHSHQK